MVTFT
jgi:hypothetical protein